MKKKKREEGQITHQKDQKEKGREGERKEG